MVIYFMLTRLSAVVVLQSPYKDDVCDEIYASALAYSGSLREPPVSVRRLVAHTMSTQMRSGNDKISGGKMTEDKIESMLIRMLKQSYMMIKEGVVFINSEFYNTTNSIERHRLRMITQSFTRNLVLFFFRTGSATVEIVSLGDVAKETSNPVVTQLKSLRGVHIRHSAGANPASRLSDNFGTAITNVLKELCKATMPKDHTDDITKIMGRLHDMELQVVALRSQNAKLCTVSNSAPKLLRSASQIVATSWCRPRKFWTTSVRSGQ